MQLVVEVVIFFFYLFLKESWLLNLLAISWIFRDYSLLKKVFRERDGCCHGGIPDKQLEFKNDTKQNCDGIHCHFAFVLVDIKRCFCAVLASWQRLIETGTGTGDK